jgi:hypothetical protein
LQSGIALIFFCTAIGGLELIESIPIFDFPIAYGGGDNKEPPPSVAKLGDRYQPRLL